MLPGSPAPHGDGQCRVRYGDLAAGCTGEGAIRNTASSAPHPSLAGACATGAPQRLWDRNGDLATAVAGWCRSAPGGTGHPHPRARRGRLLGGGGSPGRPGRGHLAHPGPGAGVRRCARRCTRASPGALEAHFDQVLSAAYSVSLFTDWQGDQIAAGVAEAPDRERTGPGPAGLLRRRPRAWAPGTLAATPRRARRSWGSPGRGTTACPTSARVHPQRGAEAAERVP